MARKQHKPSRGKRQHDPKRRCERLARERQGPAGVTLSWPTVLKIIEELPQLQREVGYLRELESNVPACRFHARDFEACIGYCSTVPCEPISGDAEVPR